MGYIFPIETSTRKIAQTILDDIATRPEVLNPPDKPDAPYKVPKMENKNDGTVKTTPTLTDMMVAYAEDAVELGKRGFNIALDYSEESLKQVEAILDRYHKDLPKNKKDRPPEDRIWTIANGWAGYIGEVIRKTWGGEWVHESYSPPGATIILKIGSFDIFLPAKVYKRLVNGSEDNIWHLYQVLKAQFEAAGMISK
jgi:ribulose bisphosphate carboxylase small subunit